MTQKGNKQLKRRVIALLTREEIEFLDRLSTDSSFSTGYKLSRVDIIGALVDAAMAMELSAVDVHSKDELVARMLEITRSRIDRRNFPRIKKSLKIGFRVMDSLKEFKESVTEDLSLGGFRMDVESLEEPVALHQVIELTLNDAHGPGPLKAIGRVIWIRRKSHSSGFEIGVRLTYIPKDEEERFRGHLLDEAASNPESHADGKGDNGR